MSDEQKQDDVPEEENDQAGEQDVAQEESSDVKEQAKKEEDDAEEKKKSKRKKVLLILGIAVILCLAAIAIFLLLRDKFVDIDSGDIPTGTMIGLENVDDIMKDIEEKVAMGMFETHMNMIWNFPDGRSPSSNAVMGNSASNNFAFWFTVSVSGDIVFTSGLMPTGTQISEVKLDEPLAEGTYPAVVNINMVQDDGTPIEANMGISITLIIES